MYGEMPYCEERAVSKRAARNGRQQRQKRIFAGYGLIDRSADARHGKPAADTIDEKQRKRNQQLFLTSLFLKAFTNV